jgi:regulator of sigma E protease
MEEGDIKAIDLGNNSSRKRTVIGISPHFERIEISFSEALEIAPRHVWYVTKFTVIGIYSMVSGDVSTKHLAGPIFIFGEAAKSAERGLDPLFNFLIVLNISLAIFNLLPVPVLDGGHLLFFTIGALRGKPVSLRLQQLASQVGMFLLLALVVFVMSNDIIRVVSG